MSTTTALRASTDTDTEADAGALQQADVLVAGMVVLAHLADDVADWSADERTAVLHRLDRAIDGLAAVRARVLVAEREAGTWQGAGDRSFEAWRARTSRTGERVAGAQVRQAEQLAAVPAAGEAVASGRISLDHAAVIARVAGAGTPAQRDAASSTEGQEHLLALAEESDAGTFALAVARWASTVDSDGLERDHEAQRSERFLHVADTPRGTWVKGRLDRIAGNRLRQALEALSPRPAADDDRDAGQRRADALDAMASRILASADTKPGGHVPPQVSMILTAETWAAARAERDRRRTARGDGCEATSSSPDGSVARYAPATLEDGTPVPATELAAVMCDCDITRIVIDADGIPLDLGRTQRLFTREQRRAVIARDRECIWPGCHVHARWCEVHHLRWWERDAGPTSVDNGGLLCGFHHHETHRRDLTITRVLCAGRAREARGRPPDGIALAAYEFRDPAGRLVGASEDHAPPPPRPTPSGSPPPGSPPPGSPLAPSAAVRGMSADERDDDLHWVTDPHTGMRMPSFFVHR